MIFESHLLCKTTKTPKELPPASFLKRDFPQQIPFIFIKNRNFLFSKNL